VLLLRLTRPTVQQHDVPLARLLLDFERRLALLQAVDAYKEWKYTSEHAEVWVASAGITRH
jgi:hypothetical protein